MTLQEIWLTLIGHPEKAAEAAAAKAAVAPEEEDPRVEALDWATTDSPSELRERAERARKAATTVA